MNPTTSPQRARAHRAPATAILAGALILLGPAVAASATWDAVYEGSAQCGDYFAGNYEHHIASRAMGYVRKDGVNAVVFGSQEGNDTPIGELSRQPGSNEWRYAALGTLTGGPPGFDPMAYVRSDGISTVIYKSYADYAIHELALVNGKWSHANLSAAANPPGRDADQGAYWGYVRGDKVSAVVYIDVDEAHIHELSLVGGRWHDADLSVAAGDQEAWAGAAAGLHAYVRADGTSAIVYWGDDGWRELALYNGKWHLATIGMQANQTGWGSSPMGYVRADGVNAVVYLGDDNHIHELSQVAGKVKGFVWTLTDLTAATGGPTAFGAPWAFVREDHVSAVYYSDTLYPHHVHELALVGGKWTDKDLTADTGVGGGMHTTAFIDTDHGTVVSGCTGLGGSHDALRLSRDGLLPP